MSVLTYLAAAVLGIIIGAMSGVALEALFPPLTRRRATTQAFVFVASILAYLAVLELVGV